MDKYDRNVWLELSERAHFLETKKDSDWAEEHPEAWDDFAVDLEEARIEKQISYSQYVELALIAFWDYVDLYEDDNEKGWWN